MKFKKLRLALASVIALLGLPMAYSIAASPISSGGSIFPLTMISQPLNNSVDEFNQWLILANQQLVGLSTVYPGAVTIPSAGVDSSAVVFSGTIQQNPLMQDSLFTVPVSGVGGNLTGLNSAGAVTLIASETGRQILPTGGMTIMVSGTAATATALLLQCSGGATIAQWPIAFLVSNVPVGIYTSTVGTTLGSALTRGCPSGQALYLSNVGTLLTTSSQVYINLPYTVQ